MYEVRDVTLNLTTGKNGAVGWQATSWGLYKAATGAAAALAGKTFTSVAHLTGPRTFTVENTIDD